MVLRSYLSVGAVSRSKGKNAFLNASKLVVENMLKSFARRLEVQLMYGQAAGGIGVVESISTNTITIEAHEWAAGIWSGSENMPIEVRSSAGILRGEAAVSATSLNDRTVTLATAIAGVVATDVIYYAGAFNQEFAGIHRIITNTATIFDIDASQYALFRGNTVPVGTNFSGGEAVLSFERIEDAIAVGMEKGLSDEKVCVICNPKSWNNLLTDLAAKRRYDSSYDQAELKQGTQKIMFYGQNGEIEIVPSIYCKEGYAYVIQPETFMRVGSSDIAMNMPGFENKFIKVLENLNGYEIRSYTDQALLCVKPGLNTLLTFIRS